MGSRERKKTAVAGENHYYFVEEEVLASPELIRNRRENLLLAQLLGRNYGKIVRFEVMMKEGPRTLQGCILAVTETAVILKDGPQIPVHAICEIRIF